MHKRISQLVWVATDSNLRTDFRSLLTTDDRPSAVVPAARKEQMPEGELFDMPDRDNYGLVRDVNPLSPKSRAQSLWRA